MPRRAVDKLFYMKSRNSIHDDLDFAKIDLRIRGFFPEATTTNRTLVTK